MAKFNVHYTIATVNDRTREVALVEAANPHEARQAVQARFSDEHNQVIIRKTKAAQ